MRDNEAASRPLAVSAVALPLEFLIDSRLGGVPRRYLGRSDKPLMRVADEIRECAIFLCYKSMGTGVPAVEVYKPCGTGFLVSVPLPDYPQVGAMYIVTARHIIDRIPRLGLDRKVYLRVNRRDSEPEIVGVDLGEWIFHPSDRGVDVAVLPAVFYDPTGYEVRAIPQGMAATAEVIHRESIGIGDDVFFTGLFINHYGKNRSLPILRIGNIAMMPEEPLAAGGGTLMDAFLVESRSIGGLSGSPVFVSVAGPRRGTTGMLSTAVLTSQSYWLGLMHGHWDGPLSDADAVGEKEERVNMGIAIVIPADKILEVLNQERLVAERRAMADKLNQSNPPTPD